MFKIKYADLLQAPLHEALSVLSNEKGSTEAVYNLMRLSRRLANEMQTAGQTHKKISEEYFERDENGKFIPHENPTALRRYKITAGKENEFHERMEAFLMTEAEIQSHKLDLKDFPDFLPTASLVSALEPILVAQE